MSWGIKRGTGEEEYEGQRALYREYILKNEINYYFINKNSFNNYDYIKPNRKKRIEREVCEQKRVGTCKC